MTDAMTSEMNGGAMAAANEGPAVRTLRELVEQRVEVQWAAFEREHPYLAAAIDRARFVESTVQRLAEDEAFVEAMRAAERDEAARSAAAQVVRVIDAWVGRALGI